MTAGLLWACSGYYDYEQGYEPEFPGAASFRGQLFHPQHWPEDLDYAGKKVVVIGSGATAVTLVPAMASDAASVTMLQRSPTYIVPSPARDPLARLLRRLPQRPKFSIVRWKNVLVQMATFNLARRRPKLARRLIRAATVKSLPEGFPVDEHFTPDYNPWEQRLCVVPNGDLFRALSNGSAEIVTDTIETFTETGIRLSSGRELEADIVVSATGLKVLAFGGLKFEVDGAAGRSRLGPCPTRRSCSAGCPTSSTRSATPTPRGRSRPTWSRSTPAVSLDHLDRNGLRYAVAERDPAVAEKPFIDFNSGYVLRAVDFMPKQGDREPWMLKQNYITDVRKIRRDDIDDGVLQFA